MRLLRDEKEEGFREIFRNIFPTNLNNDQTITITKTLEGCSDTLRKWRIYDLKDVTLPSTSDKPASTNPTVKSFNDSFSKLSDLHFVY